MAILFTTGILKRVCKSSQLFKTGIVLIRSKDFGLFFLLQIVIALEPHTAFEFFNFASIMAKIIY